MRLTYARFDEFDAQAIVEDWPSGWRLSHAAREANRRRILDGRLDRDLWVFAYGSLIWDPAVYVEEFRFATLDGWHRSFCMRLTGARATFDRPGLMAGLIEGGICKGVAFRIPSGIADRETETLWMREMFSGAYEPKFVPVRTPQGVIEALAFMIDKSNERYIPEMPLAEAAEFIAHAEGSIGPNFDYLDALCSHLSELGLDDVELSELHSLAVAIRGRKTRLP